MEQKKQVEIETPEQVILRLYEIGIEACWHRDQAKVGQVLRELIAALNFDYGEMATAYYNMYDYALRILEQQKYNEIRDILSELHDAWEQVIPAMDGPSQSLRN